MTDLDPIRDATSTHSPSAATTKHDHPPRHHRRTRGLLEVAMSELEFTLTPKQMIATPETKLRRLWRRLRRRPAPTTQPPGTYPVVIDIHNADDSLTRYYIPAGQFEMTSAPLTPYSEDE